MIKKKETPEVSLGEFKEVAPNTKAMQIDGVGCVVQVTTQQGDNIAEALTFVPGCKIEESKNENGEVVSRKLVSKNS